MRRHHHYDPKAKETGEKIGRGIRAVCILWTAAMIVWALSMAIH